MYAHLGIAMSRTVNEYHVEFNIQCPRYARKDYKVYITYRRRVREQRRQEEVNRAAINLNGK